MEKIGNRKNVFVIGMGMSSEDLTASQLEAIRSAQILMGGRRHLAYFDDLNMRKEVITGRVDETVAFIKEHNATYRIVVLASGDPMFFGIGDRIVRAVGPEHVSVSPNITSVAAAFARIKEPWNDCRIISLHGRNKRYTILAELKKRQTVAVLTDPKQSPQWLAQWLVDKGVDQVEMAVFEKLGSAEERFGWHTLTQAAGRSFDQPAIVLLRPVKNASEKEKLSLGMTEDSFAHDAGMITKTEVRAVTLAKLQLRPGMTLWDLGAGSGSVGIEASVLLGSGRIIAVEKNPERVENIRENALRYGVFNHETLQADLPDGLERLPQPDRIFIGGGGSALIEILPAAIEHLGPGGVVIINTVLVHNLSRAVDTMEAAGMEVDVVQLNVSRSKAMPWSRRLEAQNPVWIVTGCNNTEM